jgi:hypothetical protein
MRALERHSNGALVQRAVVIGLAFRLSRPAGEILGHVLNGVPAVPQKRTNANPTSTWMDALKNVSCVVALDIRRRFPAPRRGWPRRR